MQGDLAANSKLHRIFSMIGNKESKIIPNEYILTNLFNIYNMRMFNGVLATPTFQITNSKYQLGTFRYSYIGQTDNTIIIEISGMYKYTKYQLLSVLVHEMIHYYMSAVKYANTVNHGYDFLYMANQLNKSYEFHITPTIDLTDFEKIEGKSIMSRLFDWLFC